MSNEFKAAVLALPLAAWTPYKAPGEDASALIEVPILPLPASALRQTGDG